MKKWICIVLLFSILLCGCGITHDGYIGVSEPCESHSDVNDNGLCDRCQTNVVTTFDFYAINDLHGKLVDGENHPGVDELTTFLKNVHLSDDNPIFLSTGDMWQGAAESNLTQGLIITDWMNEMGFAAMALGNHEFDWGEDAIQANADFADFPFLAINIYDRTTNTLVDYCQPSVVVEEDGIQIGIIGATGDCYSSISSDKVENVYFKTGNDLTQLVKDESTRLRTEEGVDFVVYVIHDGYGSNGSTSGALLSPGQLSSYYDISLSDGYVNLVFEGHTHKGYLAMDASGVYHLQNRGDNQGGISHVEIAINTVTGSFEVTEKELISTSHYASLADDKLIADLLLKYKDQVSLANKVVGMNGTFRNSGFLRSTVAQLYYEVGKQEWGDQYEVVLGGGFISIRSPYDLPQGEVTYGQLQSLFPFDNDLVLCSIKGSDLNRKFIHTSNSNYYISGNAALMAQIDPDSTYYIVVDTYTAYYAPNRLTIVEQYQPGIYARDLLADYIGQGGLQ